jgi:hypothetical protein
MVLWQGGGGMRHAECSGSIFLIPGIGLQEEEDQEEEEEEEGEEEGAPGARRMTNSARTEYQFCYVATFPSSFDSFLLERTGSLNFEH